MGEAAQSIIIYTFIFLYAFFKVIVVIHAVKNRKSNLLILSSVVPGIDLYYYFKYIKAGN